MHLRCCAAGLEKLEGTFAGICRETHRRPHVQPMHDTPPGLHSRYQCGLPRLSRYVLRLQDMKSELTCLTLINTGVVLGTRWGCG